MNIEIRRLTPDLLHDYLRFFESDAHADNPDEDRCYCVCWCSDDHREGKDFSTPEKRRALAISYIENGIIEGYLAYHGGTVVGWCNANKKDDCLNCISWLRTMASVNTTEPNPNTRIKSVFCFAIAPRMKRQGISTQLLERVCKDAAEDGYDFVEAYPNKEFINEFRAFRGPTAMYERLGFCIHEETERLLVMRKQLS